MSEHNNYAQQTERGRKLYGMPPRVELPPHVKRHLWAKFRRDWIWPMIYGLAGAGLLKILGIY